MKRLESELVRTSYVLKIRGVRTTLLHARKGCRDVSGQGLVEPLRTWQVIRYRHHDYLGQCYLGAHNCRAEAGRLVTCIGTCGAS